MSLDKPEMMEQPKVPEGTKMTITFNFKKENEDGYQIANAHLGEEVDTVKDVRALLFQLDGIQRGLMSMIKGKDDDELLTPRFARETNES